MGMDRTTITDKGKEPLTREEVERRLAAAGTSERLDLHRENLSGVDLSNLDLHGANLNGADLRRANLRRADLRRADLSMAQLNHADLTEANLSEASLSWANLSGAHLSGADLRRADLNIASLNRADLSGAYLFEASLRQVNLRGANLSGANLRRANLVMADLSEANLTRADLTRAIITADQYAQLQEHGIINLDTARILRATRTKGSPQPVTDPLGSRTPDEMIPLSFRILEDSLTAHTLTTVLSAFTELHTKCWLIQQGRFADLMDYTQTHQPRFAQEANLRITRLSYNSPADVVLIVQQLLGGALKTAIDAVMLAPLRFKEKQLDLEAQKQELERQKREAKAAEKERQLQLKEHEIALDRQHLELEKERFTWEQQRLVLVTETATTLVGALQPEADPQTKAMAARVLVPQLLAFGQVQGLEITLLAEPAPPQESSPPAAAADAGS